MSSLQSCQAPAVPHNAFLGLEEWSHCELLKFIAFFSGTLRRWRCWMQLGLRRSWTIGSKKDLSIGFYDTWVDVLYLAQGMIECASVQGRLEDLRRADVQFFEDSLRVECSQKNEDQERDDRASGEEAKSWEGPMNFQHKNGWVSLDFSSPGRRKKTRRRRRKRRSSDILVQKR